MHAHEFEPAPGAAQRVSVKRDDGSPAPTVAAGPAAVLHLQRMAGNESVSALLADERDEDRDQERSPVLDVVGSGGGSPLDRETRSFMESRLGQDFSDVRIHTGGQADESARSVNAQAYTVGTDVVFRSGTYEPETDAGRRVLAHELTHVVQQKAGPVSGTPVGGGIRLSDPSDAFEQAAERSAEHVMSGPAPAPGAAAAPGVQRQDEELEEEPGAQALTAQRQEEEPVEEEMTGG